MAQAAWRHSGNRPPTLDQMRLHHIPSLSKIRATMDKFLTAKEEFDSLWFSKPLPQGEGRAGHAVTEETALDSIAWLAVNGGMLLEGDREMVGLDGSALYWRHSEDRKATANRMAL